MMFVLRRIVVLMVLRRLTMVVVSPIEFWHFLIRRFMRYVNRVNILKLRRILVLRWVLTLLW